MTKTQQRKEINKRFYKYVNYRFPNYELNFEEGGGRVYLIPTNTTKEGDDSIEYHQSRHQTTCLKWASESVKEDCEEMQYYLDGHIIPFVKEFLSKEVEA